jgi:hypothetical protein
VERLRQSVRSSWRTFVVCGVILLVLSAVTWVAVTPPGHLSAPRSGPRDYRASSLEAVLQDLEEHAVIPSGTQWELNTLRRRVVTVSWLYPRDRQALEQIATAAGVLIQFPMGRHGEIIGPVIVKEARGEPPGIYVAGTRVSP